jgi:hypothetical protein
MKLILIANSPPLRVILIDYLAAIISELIGVLITKESLELARCLVINLGLNIAFNFMSETLSSPPVYPNIVIIKRICYQTTGVNSVSHGKSTRLCHGRWCR